MTATAQGRLSARARIRHFLPLQETQTRPEGQIHFFPIIMDGALFIFYCCFCVSMVEAPCPHLPPVLRRAPACLGLCPSGHALLPPISSPPSLHKSAAGQQLYNVMVERCGPSQTSGPKA